MGQAFAQFPYVTDTPQKPRATIRDRVTVPMQGHSEGQQWTLTCSETRPISDLAPQVAARLITLGKTKHEK